MTDRDRQRLYDAEEAALGGTILDELLSWDDLTALADAVLWHPWWIEMGAHSPSVVQARRDATRSSADGSTIRIAAGGATALTLAHEVAHHLVAHLGAPDPGHGEVFRAAELRVLHVVGGQRARAMLAVTLSQHGLAVASWAHPEPTCTDGVAASLVSAGPGRVRGAVPLGPG